MLHTWEAAGGFELDDGAMNEHDGLVAAIAANKDSLQAGAAAIGILTFAVGGAWAAIASAWKFDRSRMSRIEAVEEAAKRLKERVETLEHGLAEAVHDIRNQIDTGFAELRRGNERTQEMLVNLASGRPPAANQPQRPTLAAGDD